MKVYVYVISILLLILWKKLKQNEVTMLQCRTQIEGSVIISNVELTLEMRQYKYFL